MLTKLNLIVIFKIMYLKLLTAQIDSKMLSLNIFVLITISIIIIDTKFFNKFVKIYSEISDKNINRGN